MTAMKRIGTRLHGLARHQEEMKQAEDDKHMRQIDLITALGPNNRNGARNLRTAPFSLSNGNDDMQVPNARIVILRPFRFKPPRVCPDRNAEAENQKHLRRRFQRQK